MHFFKYHGTGNDFIIIDDFAKKTENRKSVARHLCHRRFGIGADGCLFLEKSKGVDCSMLIFNADGSEAEMCGNGIRCVGKYLYEKRKIEKKEMSIKTKAGIREISLTLKNGKVESVRVDMGAPHFQREKIPALGHGLFLKEKMKVAGETLEISALNTGVPHAVVFVEDIQKVPVVGWGRTIRNDKVFPEGANVDFVEHAGKNLFWVRTYERGVEDETWTCGTGVTASSVVAAALGMADSSKLIKIRTQGGELSVTVDMKGGKVEKAYMSGPAQFVFEGDV